MKIEWELIHDFSDSSLWRKGDLELHISVYDGEEECELWFATSGGWETIDFGTWEELHVKAEKFMEEN